MRGKYVRPISEFRRDAAVAVSNAATAAQRLLSEPPNRRGDVESSLAMVNNCRRILHALAAISDYPTREPLQFDSDALNRVVEALAQALDDLASSLELDQGTGRDRLPDLSELSQCLENAPLAAQIAVSESVSGPKNSEALAWLFNHLKNAVDLVLATSEVLARLLRSEEPAALGNR